MVFVEVEGGCFEMGSPETEAGRDGDERQHRVCMKGFFLAQHEVTVGDFRRFVQATGYRTEAEREGGCYGWVGEWLYQKGKYCLSDVGCGEERTASFARIRPVARPMRFAALSTSYRRWVAMAETLINAEN
jgi:formylglycine-generating enzyme required for sulfatase activity